MEETSKVMKITYSEIFRSLQGEGMYTGSNTVWLRLFNCNLQCSGFGQKFPTKPETYELPFEDFDIHGVNRIEDLPVWKTGCDSSYSWSKKFKHLNYQDTPEVIAEKITNLLVSNENPNGTFLHDSCGMETHMCFTGGEPLLPANQRAILAILREFENMPGGLMPGCNHRKSNNMPRYITFETNGTQTLLPEFIEFFNKYSTSIRVLFSVSPKLYTVSGEHNNKAIKPEVVSTYKQIACKGQLKFVLGNSKDQWDELDGIVKKFRSFGIEWPIFIMPVGALEEDQQKIAAQVADMALNKGYHVSARVHAYIYGNVLGT